MAWFGRGHRGIEGLFDDRPAPILGAPGREEEALVGSPGEELVAHLYKGSRVNGQLTFHGTARIDGSVDGEILCHGRLTIGEGAEVRANIAADVVVIHGEVEGDVTAKQQVELGRPARLLGNIAAPRLVVTEGVVFDGHCTMGGAREKREVLTPLSSNSEKAFEGGSPKLMTISEK